MSTTAPQRTDVSCRRSRPLGLATVMILLMATSIASAQTSPTKRQPSEEIELVGQKVTDAELARLGDLSQVKKLRLRDTAVSFSAVDRLVEAHPQLQCSAALSESLYESYLEACRASVTHVAPLLSAYDEALGWKLDIAPYKDGPCAVRRAFEQYLRYLAQIRQILKNTPSSDLQVELALVDCAEARGKMRMAVCEGNPSQALATGLAAQQLPELAWQACLPNGEGFESFVVATRLSKDLRIQVARLSKSREGEQQVRQQVIARYKDAVRALFKHQPPVYYSGGYEILALAATLLSAEEASLARFTGAETPDTWKRARGRAYTLTHLSYFSTGEDRPTMPAVLLKTDLASEIDIADA